MRAVFQFAAAKEKQAMVQQEMSWLTLKTCRSTGSVTIAVNQVRACQSSVAGRGVVPLRSAPDKLERCRAAVMALGVATMKVTGYVPVAATSTVQRNHRPRTVQSRS
jgi:GTPase